MNTGSKIVYSDFGLLTTIAYQVTNIFIPQLCLVPLRASSHVNSSLNLNYHTIFQLGSSPPTYALEGSIAYAGSTVQVVVLS